MGGSRDEQALAVGITKSGAIAVSGITQSPDLPTTNDSYQRSLRGEIDGFLALLSSDGHLEHITYIGGSGEDWVAAMDCGSDSIWLGGFSDSNDAPAPLGEDLPEGPRTKGGMLLEFDPLGRELRRALYVGGSGSEHIDGVLRNDEQVLYFVGATRSSDLETVGGASGLRYGGRGDVFVGGYDLRGGAMSFLGYIGGSAEERTARGGLALDQESNLVLVGSTASNDLPAVAGGAQSTFAGGNYDAFVARVAPDGALIGATYLGAAGALFGGDDYGLSLRIQGKRIVVGGNTQAQDFPNDGLWCSERPRNEGDFAFLAVLSSDLRDIWHVDTLGGEGFNIPWAITGRNPRNLVVVGATSASVGGLGVDEEVYGTPGAMDVLVGDVWLPTCTGDCDLDEGVTVDELVRMISVGLGQAMVAGCEAGDVDENGEITVEEIVGAVDRAIGGCR